MCDAAGSDERIQLGGADVERQGPGELPPEPPTQTKTECGERVLLPLHDDAHACSARQGRFQIIRKRRAALSFGMSREQHENDKECETHKPTHRHTSITTRAPARERRGSAAMKGKGHTRAGDGFWRVVVGVELVEGERLRLRCLNYYETVECSLIDHKKQRVWK